VSSPAGFGSQPRQSSGFTIFEVLRKSSPDVIHALWGGPMFAQFRRVRARFVSKYAPALFARCVSIVTHEIRAGNGSLRVTHDPSDPLSS